MTDTYTVIGSGWGAYPSWFTFWVVIATVVGLPVWYIAASTITLREAPLDRPNRVANLYGYTICLIAILMGLASLNGLLGTAFERANPLQAEGGPFGVELLTFDAFKAQRAVAPSFARDTPALPDTASEATLRLQYDALVAARIADIRYRTTKDLVTQGIFLAIALVLFRFHWRWVRRLSDGSPAVG